METLTSKLVLLGAYHQEKVQANRYLSLKLKSLRDRKEHLLKEKDRRLKEIQIVQAKVKEQAEAVRKAVRLRDQQIADTLKDQELMLPPPRFEVDEEILDYYFIINDPEDVMTVEEEIEELRSARKRRKKVRDD